MTKKGAVRLCVLFHNFNNKKMCLSQGQMTEEGKKKMFEIWRVNAPKEPKNGGWFGSLMSCADENGQYYSSPIEDYEENGAIVSIGGAQLRLPSLEYVEYFNVSN